MKKSRISLGMAFLALCALMAFNIPPQESQLLKNIISKLLIYNTNEGPEKTYLHTDKDFYTNGETIWFKTYLVDGITHTQSDKSKVVYVELINTQDSVIAKRKLYVNGLGASGDIALSNDMPQGNYKLRTYTKYMLNEEEPVVYQKKIPIVVQKIRPKANLEGITGSSLGNSEAITPGNQNKPFGTPDVRFFPEGGHLVEGISTMLGIEVTDRRGNGVSLKGVIKDANGETVVPFESHEFGLGKVNFKPEPNTSYYASIEFNGEEKTFPLPKAIVEGYGLSVKNRGDHLLLQVGSTTEEGVAGTLLIGHLRGKLIFKRIGKTSDKDAYGVKLYNDELLDGVAQFTLFAPNGEPVCERLVFVDNPNNDAELFVAANNDSYGFREKVDLDLLLTDTNGVPLNGDFSLGVVTKSNDLGRLSTNADIRSWLLLDSDLGGTVPDPDFFFNDNSKERRQLLDALMLTHGWRRFVWTDMLGKKVSKSPRHAPEKGIMITGKTTKPQKAFETKKTKASLTLFGDGVMHEEQVTDNQGRFSFGPFRFVDSVSAIVQAVDSSAKREHKKRDFSVFLDSPFPEFNLESSGQKKSGRETLTYNTEYLKESYKAKVTDFRFDPKEVTPLDEVVVSEKKISRREIIDKEYNSHQTSTLFSRRVYKDSISGGEALSAIDLLARIPGVWVSGVYPMQTVSLPGGPRTANSGSSPLVLVDGLPTNLSFLQPLRASEVSFVDIVWGPDTAYWGARGAGGVIAVYTDRGSRLDQKVVEVPGITSFTIPGFYKAREFYKPNYVKEDPEKPDYRTTLFWEPDVNIDNSGRALVSFFTGDSPGTYLIEVEGMAHDGRPVRNIQTIEVQESN